jgi:hypothetical protein
VEILRKVFFGLEQFWGAAPTLVNPVIGLLFLMAWLNETDSPRRRELFAVVTGSLGLGVVGSCLFRSEPGFLLAWEPLFAILGAAYVSARLGRRFEQVEAGSRIWKTGAYVIVIALVSFPLGFLMLMSRSEPGDQERGEYLSYLLPPEATVMTDQPAFVAWYADRRAVWLCQRKEDWEALERLGGPVDATYVTSAITRMAANEQGDWWVWLVSPRGPYRRLVSVPSLSSNAVLRVRPEGRSQQGPPRPHGIRPPENAK